MESKGELRDLHVGVKEVEERVSVANVKVYDAETAQELLTSERDSLKCDLEGQCQ